MASDSVLHLKHPAEGSLADVADVDDVVSWIFEELQSGVDACPSCVVVAVLRQLGQVDLPVLDLERRTSTSNEDTYSQLFQREI